MKIAFITQDFPPEHGGIQTYSYEIAKRLATYADDFVLFAPDKPQAAAIDSKLDYAVVRVKSSNTLLAWKGKSFINNYLNTRPVDIVFHAQWQTLPIGIEARKKGNARYLVVAAHAREYFFNPFKKIPLLGQWYEKHKIKCLQQADHFLPVSQFTSDTLSHYKIAGQDKTVLINGTDPQQFFPIENRPLKKEFNLSDQFILFSLCRLVHRKGMDIVLEALSKLVEKAPNIHYIIGGSGPYKEALQKQCTALKLDAHVTFTGKIPLEQLNHYYNLCDIFCMPARAITPDIEGFGIVFLEANAAGKAVIGAATGGIPSAILHEKTGLLVREEDPVDLAKAILRLYENTELREQLGKAGRARVEEEANWDAIGQKMATLLKSKLDHI